MLSDPALTDAVDALAGALGCPLVLEDAEFRVIAYSAIPGQADDPLRNEAIVRRRTPEQWLNWIDTVPGRREQLESGDPVLVAEAFPGLRRRMVMAMRDGLDVLGYLWVLEGMTGFPDCLAQDLTDFQDRIAADLSRSGKKQNWAAESRTVRLVVSGDATTNSLSGSGIGADWLVTASAAVGASGRMDYQDLNELVDAIRHTARGGRRHVSLTGIVERRVCRLDFYPPTTDADRNVEVLKHCAQQGAGRLHRPIVMTSGLTVELEAADMSWRQAVAASELLARREVRDYAISTFAEVQTECLTSAVTAFIASRPELTAGLLVTTSGRSDPERDHTMLTFLEQNGSIPRTAEILRLHPNSVRYRIRRIEQELPVRWDDPTGRLALHLALLTVRERGQ